MSTFALVVFISAMLATTSAQSQPPSSSADSNPTVWASVAMVMHGERTPVRSNLSDTLTPHGAQQLYAQGAAFRTRYLSSVNPLHASDAQNITHASIRGIARNVIEHAQLSILSVAESHISSGATAFMQALYPPITQAFAVNTGGSKISFSTSSGNYTQYPLDGYQYPVIQTVDVLDQRSIDLRGNTECPRWRISTQVDLRRDPEMLKLYNSSLPQYRSLFSEPPLNDGIVNTEKANFWDAYNLWDLVRYRNSHEEAVYDAMADTYNKDRQFLERYAKSQQLAMTSSQTQSRLRSERIRPIAGQTFARSVVEAFQANVDYGGSFQKMTLMFSSHEPFMSFFFLAELQRDDVPRSSPFWGIPEQGAAMVFELIGDEPNQPDAYPSEDNLYVRFLYRRNADADSAFEEYPLFGNSDAAPVSRTTYSYFKQEMLKFGVDVSEWCSRCASSQPFCPPGAADAAPQSGPAGGSVGSAAQRPFVAGIIGAAIVLAVLGAAVAAAAIFGGFRIRRAGRDGNNNNDDAAAAAAAANKDGHHRFAGLGFKAAAEKKKKDSDPDVSVNGRGVVHERQGSWELREGRDVDAKGGAGAGLGIIAMDKTPSRFRAKDVDDDELSLVGASPVMPKESV